MAPRVNNNTGLQSAGGLANSRVKPVTMAYAATLVLLVQNIQAQNVHDLSCTALIHKFKSPHPLRSYKQGAHGTLNASKLQLQRVEPWYRMQTTPRQMLVGLMNCMPLNDVIQSSHAVQSMRRGCHAQGF